MKIRLADYIADFLVSRGISDCFTVVGGGAMHLNDAFGHKNGLVCHYNHHEQACAIAAEAYARLDNRPALVCVTTGPGGTNAITGVLGAWLDSIPMFVVSGQVRYDTTARYAERFTDGLPLRAVGDQEFDITRSVGCMCKYAEMLEKPEDIRYMLEKAWFLMKAGRPGPVWLDIPVNYQGMTIETDGLRGYASEENAALLPPHVSDETADKILEKIAKAKRPVIYAGGGIRLSGGYKEFRLAAERLGVPVVTYWNSVDLMEDDDPLYCGRGGNMGDRAGNFAVQNSDLVLAVGTRISIRQVGYNWKTWAREAEVVMVDIDPAEMKKPTLHVDMAVHADAKDFFEALLRRTASRETPVFLGERWRETQIPRHARTALEGKRRNCQRVCVRPLFERSPARKQPHGGKQRRLLRRRAPELENEKGYAVYHQQRRRQHGLRSARRRRTLYRFGRQGNNMPRGRRKHHDEPSRITDDRHLEASRQDFPHQQRGLSQHPTDAEQPL